MLQNPPSSSGCGGVAGVNCVPESPASQSIWAISPTTPRCRGLLPRWFATWAALPRGVTSPTVNCGNCAARGPVRDLPVGDVAIKWGELHH